MGALPKGTPEWLVQKAREVKLSKVPDWFRRQAESIFEPEPEDEEVVERQHNRETEDFEEQLLSQIRRKEAGKWGYDAWVHRGTSRSPAPPSKKVTEMTLNEVLDWQRASRAQGNDSAIGGYQIIFTTLRSAQKSLGLSGEEIFNQDLQDRIAKDFLLRAKRSVSIDDFLSGKATKTEFANDLAKEWAGLPVLEQTTRKTRQGTVTVRPGESYYKGLNNNKALFKGPELQEYSSLFDLAEVKANNNEGNT